LSVYGNVLSKYLKDPETLFVISTDFCHWGARFDFAQKFEDTKTVGDSIEKLDRLGMTLIE
jgi:predicted class III extradiol MEMO1 family dioxygenase